MKLKNDGQLSLFDGTVKESPDAQKTPGNQSVMVEPEWENPMGLPIDLIADEYVSGFLFDLSRLEAAASTYTTPVFRVLLSALVDLSSQKKSWSQKSFTVFISEFVNQDLFYIGFGLGKSTADGELSMFLRHRLEQIPAFQGFESGSSDRCVPVFRYDKGYIVQYDDEDSAGTSFFDGDDNYGSQQTIYRRGWFAAEMYGLSKSRYSKLK